MKKYLFSIGFLALSIFFVTCKNEQKNGEIKETYATGSTSVFVEESIVPVFDDINQVFMNTYDKANVTIVPQTENEIVNYILQDSVKIAVLPRMLNDRELKPFEGKKVINQTAFAKDAIIFVNSKNSQDSIINLTEIIELIKNPDLKSDHVFVFDNINSSLTQYFKNKAGVTEFGDNVYFAKDTKEVVSYTSKNPKAIGIVGINWLLQPDEEIQNVKKDLKSMSVFNEIDKKYYLPTQSTIADGSYPLIRELFVIEAQGFSGLGKGISSFAASDRGQRIVLKSGLFPIKQPTREIIIKTN